MSSGKSILEEHFREDMLISSWLNLFSNMVAIGITIWYLILAIDSTSEKSERIYAITYSSVEIASFTFFTVGFYFALLMTYPGNFQEMICTARVSDVTKLTFIERNFTANHLLLIAWCFFCGTFICFIIPITGFILGTITLTNGFLCIIGFCIATAVLGVWVNMCRAENMVFYYGHGSSMIYQTLQAVHLDQLLDSIAQFFSGRWKSESFSEHYLGTDFKAGAWGAVIFAFGSLIYFIVLVCSYPDVEVYYLWFIVSGMWLLGAFLYAMAVMSETGNSYVLWNFFARFCCYCCCNIEEGSNVERSPLIPDNT